MDYIKPIVKRKIIHIDMDAFYASVEERDNPSLVGQPIAVGGGEHRGVITTANYVARKFGVKSAMPGFKAKALCPKLIFLPIRMQVYVEASKVIRTIFHKYTDLIEPLSLDEAFLDVTENKMGEPLATVLAQAIKDDIYKATQLSCSAGVSYCKFLAKLASDVDKPDGLTVLTPTMGIPFLEALPIEKFYGIGKVTARRMRAKGITNGAELKSWTKLELAQSFGKMGSFYYDAVRGIDDRPVESHRIRKSLAVERTLNEDLSNPDDILLVIDRIVEKFFERLRKADNFGRTISLKIKTSDFLILNRSHSEDYYIRSVDDIRRIAHQLFLNNQAKFKSIRLIGLSASNLEKEKLDKASQQLEISFEEE